MSKVLVTGAQGFIGTYVCRELRARGHEVEGVDCYLPQVHGACLGTEDMPVRVLADYCRWWGENKANDIDAVIHLAARVGVGQSQYEPAKYIDTNATDTARLWEAIAMHRKSIRAVVVASSMSIYGEGEYSDAGNRPYRNGRLIRTPERGWDAFDFEYNDGVRYPLRETPQAMPTREEKIPEPASVYAMSKYDTERYSLLLGDLAGVRTVALRFFNVVGKGQAVGNPYTGCIMNFLSRILNGQPPMVTEDGNQRRDFVHVSDVARAVVDTMECEAASGVFNVGTGVGTAVGDVAAMLCRAAADRGLATTEPTILGKYRAGDVRHCYSDSGHIARMVGWSAETDIQSVLGEIVEWVIAERIQVPDNMPKAFAELEAQGLMR